tara:strand:- start:1292 stop:1624 length:333 start_codon:yes stop_codon:yes gene_type:complete
MVTILLKGKKFIVKGLKEAQTLLAAGGKIISKPKQKSKVEEILEESQGSIPSTIFGSGTKGSGTMKGKMNLDDIEGNFKDGGLAKKKKPKSKKSRGSGAAIQGTKFKGVF